MELKIKIKEVKEEIRELTIEERCLVTVSRLPGGCSERYRAEASAKLNSIGFVANRGSQGKFRTETIRDATKYEIISWHCINIHNICPLCCGSCPMNPGYAAKRCNKEEDYNKAEALLKGKEVILELV